MLVCQKKWNFTYPSSENIPLTTNRVLVGLEVMPLVQGSGLWLGFQDGGGGGHSMNLPHEIGEHQMWLVKFY
jgi:hypothetical protein